MGAAENDEASDAIVMHSQQQEPERYSLDEMVERLRSRGENSEPELVTRPDGTQVVRVRKRKRRSRQPHKEQARRRQRLRVIQLGAAVVAAMVLVAALFGTFAYYNSSGFLDNLRGRIRQWTAAEVEFNQFRITPVRAGATTATLRWPDARHLRELHLHNVTADLRPTSFFSSGWNGDEVLAVTGTLRLGEPEGAPGMPPPPIDLSMRPPFSFTRYRCERLAVWFGFGSQPPVQLRDVETSFYLLQGAGQVRLNRGSLLVEGWPALPVERGLVEFRNGQVVVSSLRLASGADLVSGADISGTLDPAAAGPVSLGVKFERFPFQMLAGEKLSRLFQVRFDSEAMLGFVPGRYDSHELVAPFEASSGSGGVFFGGFPFLRILRNEFQDEEFGARRLSTDARGVIRRSSGGISLDDLRLEEKNFLAIRGRLAMDRAGALSGEIELGLAERLAASHRSPLFREVFKREDGGFRWATIGLSGTADNPADDFTERVRRIAEQAAPEGDPVRGAPARDDLEEEFRRLIDGDPAPGRDENSDPAPGG